jgi:hypothetical protein
MGSPSSHSGETVSARPPALALGLRCLVVCGLIAVCVPPLALGAAPVDSEHKALLDSTVRYLQEAQQPDGGFADPGTPASPGTSAWVALALAAAGINPQDQARPGGIDAYSYLDAHFRDGPNGQLPCSAMATTDFERVLLVVNAAGTDPHSFDGCDLVAEILARQLPDHSFAYLPGEPGSVNTTIFAILALSLVREEASQDAIQDATGWLIAAQGKSGGWGWGAPGSMPITDMTGAALEALAATSHTGTEAQIKALKYLHEAQGADGGFPEKPGEESNSASTAWVVQGLWAVGQDPETWLAGSGSEPLDYLESMQQEDGHIRWKRRADENGVWMTAYAAPAFAGQPLPIPAVSRNPQPTNPPPGSKEGVIAGGGGEGAPLFSRPKPKSRGKTPGGVRVVGGRHPTRDHAKSRHGENVEQSAGTAHSEPREGKGGYGTGGDSGGGSSGSGSAGGDRQTGRSSSPTAGGSAGDLLASGNAGEEKGREVSGAVIGSSKLSREGAFGAPGLQSASGEKGEGWLALGIGAAAALLALGGAGWEWRRREALA